MLLVLLLPEGPIKEIWMDINDIFFLLMLAFLTE
jgi:hypothetical protein